MIDEKKDCVIKSKLTITKKTLIYQQEKILPNTTTSRLTKETRIEKSKQKIKNEALSPGSIQINK